MNKQGVNYLCGYSTNTYKMEKNKLHPFLLLPIYRLPASREFVYMAAFNHFENLGQMVAITVDELEKLPMFGQRMLGELLELLETHELGSLLKEN